MEKVDDGTASRILGLSVKRSKEDVEQEVQEVEVSSGGKVRMGGSI